MEPISDSAHLGTIGGVAAAIYVVVQLFVKPWLRQRYFKDGMLDPSLVEQYDAVMNTVAGVLGVTLSILYAVAYPPKEGLSLAVFLTAFLVGIGGAFISIGVHETATNLNRSLRKG